MMTNSEIDALPNRRARWGTYGSRHPLVFFLLVAFAGSWVVDRPAVLSRTGTGLLRYPLPPVVVVVTIAAATFTGPTLSALVMGPGNRGQGGVRRTSCAGTCSGA